MELPSPRRVSSIEWEEIRCEANRCQIAIAQGKRADELDLDYRAGAQRGGAHSRHARKRRGGDTTLPGRLARSPFRPPGGGIVDDASTDATAEIVTDFARNRPNYRVIRNERRGNASASRNRGVAESTGEILFFLDGDDLFMHDHIDVCWNGLAQPGTDFVKTEVRLAHPVHADWRPRIRCSLVINLAIRRRCHEHIGGFFDYHLFCKTGCNLVHNHDLFTGIEDVFYNRLVERFFKGLQTARETVEYLRHPGNSYDRQYSRFQVPPGEFREVVPREYGLRIEICEALFRYTVDKLIRETRQVELPLAVDPSPSQMR
jgi:glycosyltransferase involved in cell wall biosynthesis